MSAQIRRYLNGRISNWQLDDTSDKLDDDGAHGVWCFAFTTFSDNPEYYAIGDAAITGEVREVFVRCILFLDSDLEYEWPPWNPLGDEPIFLWLCNLLTFGRAGEAHRKKEDDDLEVWRSHGDIDVWPFNREADYEIAKMSPRRLALPK